MTQSTATLNVDLLRSTLEWAYDQWHRQQRGEISEWEQGDWVIETAHRIPSYKEPVLRALIDEGVLCGTSCCVAGKIAYGLGYRQISRGSSLMQLPKVSRIHARTASEIATEALGITEEEADDLFSGDNDIYDLFKFGSDWTGGAIVIPADVAEHHQRISGVEA